MHTIAGIFGIGTYLAVSQDGKWLLSAGSGGGFGGESTVSLWDVATGQKVKDLPGNNETVYSLAISADKKYALTGGGNNQKGGDFTMRLLNLQTGQPVRQFAGHNNLVRTVHFLPDGKQHHLCLQRWLDPDFRPEQRRFAQDHQRSPGCHWKPGHQQGRPAGRQRGFRIPT